MRTFSGFGNNLTGMKILSGYLGKIHETLNAVCGGVLFGVASTAAAARQPHQRTDRILAQSKLFVSKIGKVFPKNLSHYHYNSA